jgi:hypothetical protein
MKMVTHITNRKGNKLQLSGNILTGDTFAMKDYIKSYMDGKWIASLKGWQVNVDKVNRLIAQSVLRIDDSVDAQLTERFDAIAPMSMTHAEFSRLMNDPNSDW